MLLLLSLDVCNYTPESRVLFVRSEHTNSTNSLYTIELQPSSMILEPLIAHSLLSVCSETVFKRERELQLVALGSGKQIAFGRKKGSLQEYTGC